MLKCQDSFSIPDIPVERQAQNFIFLKAKTVIEEKNRESLDRVCDKFSAEVACLYESRIEYLKKCIQTKVDFLTSCE